MIVQLLVLVYRPNGHFLGVYLFAIAPTGPIVTENKTLLVATSGVGLLI
jgi:hypothetical protein